MEVVTFFLYFFKRSLEFFSSKTARSLSLITLSFGGSFFFLLELNKAPILRKKTWNNPKQQPKFSIPNYVRKQVILCSINNGTSNNIDTTA